MPISRNTPRNATPIRNSCHRHPSGSHHHHEPLIHLFWNDCYGTNAQTPTNSIPWPIPTTNPLPHHPPNYLYLPHITRRFPRNHRDVHQTRRFRRNAHQALLLACKGNNDGFSRGVVNVSKRHRDVLFAKSDTTTWRSPRESCVIQPFWRRWSGVGWGA